MVKLYECIAIGGYAVPRSERWFAFAARALSARERVLVYAVAAKVARAPQTLQPFVAGEDVAANLAPWVPILDVWEDEK